MSEELYDTEIAPLLLKAGELCQEHGLSMTCAVEFEPEHTGMTACLSEEANVDMRLNLASMQARGNVDALFFSFL